MDYPDTFGANFCPCCGAEPSEPHDPRCCGKAHYSAWPHFNDPFPEDEQ